MIRYGRLKVFDAFRKDESLPKWQKANADNNTTDTTGFSIRLTTNNSVVGFAEGPRFSDDVDNEDMPPVLSWWQKLCNFVLRRKVPTIKPTSADVQRVFSQVIGNAEPLQQLAKANGKGDTDVGGLMLELAAYFALIKQAKDNGQVALTEKMTDAAKIFVYEAMLAACGFNRFLTEGALLEYLALPKLGTEEKPRYYEGFRLDWIANFTRILPPDVVAKKKIADSLLIFDNYAILHYDPLKAASEKTKAEKRDPILFGLIEGSNKLYFVADWIDEYCDLTFREVADALKDIEYENDDFEMQTAHYRKLLGEVGQELLKEYGTIEEMKQVAQLWLNK
jgi:hypothetical protein